MKIIPKFGAKLCLISIVCICYSSNSLAEAGAPPKYWSLDDLVFMGVRGHPAVAAKKAELDSAESNVSAAKWGFAPSLGIRNDFHNGGVGSIELNQPLWTGGRLSSGVARAEAQYDASSQSLEEASDKIAERVIAAYGDWLSNHGKKASINEVIDELKRLYKRILKREFHGVSTKTEVLLARARLSQATSDLSLIESAELAAVKQLSQLTGEEIQAGMLLIEHAIGQIPTEQLLLDAALKRSPSVQRTEAASRAAFASIEGARSALHPQVSLALQRTYGDYTVDDVDADNRIMFRVEFQPGAGISTLFGVNAANARYQAALLDVTTTERDVKTKVQTNFSRYQSIQRSISTVQATVNATRGVQASYERQFLAGKRLWQEVMNSVREVNEAQKNLATLQSEMLTLERKLTLYSYGVNRRE